MTIRRMGVATAKAQFTKVLRDVERRGDRIVIERRGKPVAILGRFDRGEAANGWFREIYGILAEDDTLEADMAAVVRSRAKQRSRTPPPVGE